MLFRGISLSLKDDDMIHKMLPVEPVKGYKVSWVKWKEQEMYLFT